MPPDIVRPVASTTLGCLVMMAHRMGMIWSDVRLDGGKFRATGDGRSFSVSLVRGMGFVVEYSSDGSRNFSIPNVDIRVPSITADKV